MLIDSDNASWRHAANVLTELAKYGTTSVRRMYGDWTTDRLAGWKTAANEHSIQPIQQFQYTTGKNATDSALIIDAMDLLHQNGLDAFAIVSSDSDFTRLAARLRESGAQVFGFGERKTPTPFVKACDVFTYFDALQVDAADLEPDLKPATQAKPVDVSKDAAKDSANAEVPETEDPAAKTTAPPNRPTQKALRSDTALMNLLRSGIAASTDEEGWANLSTVGSTIRKRSPEFDSRNWGYAKLGGLIEAIGLFTIEPVIVQNGGSTMRVSLKRKV